MKVKSVGWLYTGIAFVALWAVLMGFGYRADIPVEQLIPRYADRASKFAVIDGMRVHYRDEGQGPVLLLIHGSNSSLHTWDGWAARLRDKYRLVRLDLPGHGLTGPNPDHRYSYAAMSQTIDHLVEILGAGSFAMAGNSMGGAIALDYANRHPEKVEKLILIDSIGYPDEVPPLTLRMWGFPAVGTILTAITPRSVYAATLREAYGHPEMVTDALVDRYYELLLRQGNRHATQERFAEAAFSIPALSLSRIHARTLVLWGGKDRWFPVSFGERFAHDIAGARLKIFPDLGHVPMEEGPEATAFEADEFLAARHP
jgi:pimeloyl-ACP methyl ester carboxylesterase